ncbi:WcbI family polysaccharide biosynthesis putative acetyltransferase [Ningiella sp. W23]|uniref:WcbI family polysaccharide biosynthesis putative acetyltransferase n=1 Tax=Ningiella sp. W23 TaxID=3023715 RepID=UPI003758139E
MNLVIIGNCQARPLKDIINQINQQVTVIDTPIVHLLKAHEKDEVYATLDSADHIVTQLIADTYPCDYIRTNTLKTAFPNKVTTILNLYYAGYTPDWTYVRIPQLGTLQGPMGDYHNTTIIESWLKALTTTQTASLLFDERYNQEKYAGIASTSLIELNKREGLVDIGIVDFISEQMSKQRLFFTFNHPCYCLLQEYATRILRRMGVKEADIKPVEDAKEPLDPFIPPLNPGMDFNFPIENTFKGKCVEGIHNNGVTLGATKFYSAEELVDTFYEIYTQNASSIKAKYAS